LGARYKTKNSKKVGGDLHFLLKNVKGEQGDLLQPDRGPVPRKKKEWGKEILTPPIPET